jgi:hypothetical protein
MGFLNLPDSSEISMYIADSILTSDSVNIRKEPIIGETFHSIVNNADINSFVLRYSENEWYFFFFFILFVGYALARSSLGRLLSSTFIATIRYSNAAGMFNDNSQLQRQRDSVLYAFYFLSTGFFIMLLCQLTGLYPYNLNGFRLFAFSTTWVLAVFFAKIIMLNLIGTLFFKRRLFKEYLYVGFTYNKLLGIVLLPLNFATVYTPPQISKIILLLAIIFLSILLLLKIARGIEFSLRHNVFNFYLFLYLCALEIVPILLMYRWFQIIT